MRRYIFVPFAFPFFILLFFFFFIIIFSIPHAFTKLGIPPFIAYLLFFISLLGSTVNIPIKEIERKATHAYHRITFWGITYTIPRTGQEKTIIAINLGGAIIPISIALYIMIHLLLIQSYSLLLKTLIAMLIASLIFHLFAKPVRGIGIAMPAFLPPLIAASLSILFAPENPAVVAYVSGTLGTLIGADILNLQKIKELDTPFASIGGAGTFDGIFLAGIIAVLLV
ncbi:MAG: DUF1614 domain-containing protein [Thermoplasmata archaeon]|nr:MAG: DUF1614 domain-containing protein [Thermoplasmata archaeon]